MAAMCAVVGIFKGIGNHRVARSLCGGFSGNAAGKCGGAIVAEAAVAHALLAAHPVSGHVLNRDVPVVRCGGDIVRESVVVAVGAPTEIGCELGFVETAQSTRFVSGIVQLEIFHEHA